MITNQITDAEYTAFIKNYGNIVPPQDAKEALVDNQIKNISTDIDTFIKSSDQGTVLDIGYGSGILLERLVTIDAFKQTKKWKYLGAEVGKNHNELLHKAVDLGIRDRVDPISLIDLHNNWISVNIYPRPIFAIIRNVFHELDIDATAELVFTLSSNLGKKDLLIVQDLLTFPEAERGWACWNGVFFKEMLTFCRFKENAYVEETTKKQHKWFTLIAKHTGEKHFRIKKISTIALQQRKRQIEQWDKINARLLDDKNNPRRPIILLDLDLQRGALYKQISDVENKKQNHKQSVKLKIPRKYTDWIFDYCKNMDINKLREKGNLLQISLPEIFIPLYTDSFYNTMKIDQTISGMEGQKQVHVDIEKLVVENDYLLLEGHAGSGKTTLLKHLAYSIIDKTFSHGLKGFLPVLVFLKESLQIEQIEDYRRKKFGSVTICENFLKDYFRLTKNGIDFATVRSFCKKGKVVFLIDGFDEIDPELRSVVVNSFAEYRIANPGNKIILSGRPHGIDDSVINRFGDKVAKIHPLNMKQIEIFVSKWFKYTLYTNSNRNNQIATNMIEEIKNTPRVKQLINNPLVLTAICILYHEEKKLPEQRADLYRRLVNNLFYRRFGNDQKPPEFLKTLAFRMNENVVREGIEKSDAINIMRTIYKREIHETKILYMKRLVKQFDCIEPHCGLLKFENGQYDFSHLSFKDILTAMYIVENETDYLNVIRDYWKNERYNELIELYIGFLSFGNKKWANKIIFEKLKKQDKSPFRQWNLAAKSLLNVDKDKRDEKVVNKARERIEFIFQSKVEPKVLAEVGEILGWLSDTRELNQFVRIKRGKYTLKELGHIELKSFEIGKYPVTNQWYEEFIIENGYQIKEYWCDEGRKWLKFSKYDCPKFWFEREWKCNNAPVVGISWYEADAFCRWLTKKRNDRYLYRLPTEQEWEAVASGKDKREFPWGDWQDNRCNTKEVNIRKTTSVGIFEKGKTPDNKVADLSGNVKEWMLSSWIAKEKW